MLLLYAAACKYCCQLQSTKFNSSCCFLIYSKVKDSSSHQKTDLRGPFVSTLKGLSPLRDFSDYSLLLTGLWARAGWLHQIRDDLRAPVTPVKTDGEGGGLRRFYRGTLCCHKLETQRL